MNHVQQLREAAAHLPRIGLTRDIALNAASYIETLETEVRQWRILVNQDPNQPFTPGQTL